MKSYVKVKSMISIQGNIGSGKSTVVHNLQKDKSLICLQEPVDMWADYKSADGRTILENFYEDRKKYAFPFQMMAFYTRLKNIKNHSKDTNNIIVMERSLETDKRIFAQLLIDDGSIDQISAKIYNEWFTDLTQDQDNIVNIYIRTPPEVCYKRIAIRNRPGEQHIPLEYLERCHKLHDDWLLNSSAIVIDGEKPVDTILEQIQSEIKSIISRN